MSSNISEKTLQERVDFHNVYGDTATMNEFGINEKTLREYLRIAKHKEAIKKSFKMINGQAHKNVLVIGDTHIPYEKEGYLEFCQEQYSRFNCDTVVHIGDIVDHHATSFHPSIPDAYSAGQEIEYTKEKLKAWYKAFPDMMVVRGNHDERPFRLAANAGISSHWMKSFTEVLGVPNWSYEESYDINGTHYTHGTGTSGITAAHRRALYLGKNIVMGHLHSESSIIYHKMHDKTLFGMIVGAGVDEESFGMNYAKNFPKKSICSVGVVLDKQPIIVIM